MTWNKLISWLKTIFNPQYQLTLSEIKRSKFPYKTKYIFKEYGSHEFISLTYKDIQNNETLIHIINPTNILYINSHESNLRKEYNKYYIIEEFRGNKYKIKSMNEESIYTGEYICENIDLFNEINTKDLCKIIYATGFHKGRRVSTALKATDADRTKMGIVHSDNIINFKTQK